MADDERKQIMTTHEEDIQSGPSTHITFADMGIPTSDQLQNTVVGKTRPCSDISWTERSYTILMLTSILAAAVITVYRLITTDINSEDFTVCVVLLINAVFCIWFVVEGVLRERLSEIVILTLATAIILVYLIVDYTTGVQNDVKLAQLIVACVFCPAVVILGLFIAWIYYVSRRLVFRTVGANEMLQSCYITLLMFQDFLKFDLQLAVSMIAFIVTTPYDITIEEILVLSMGSTIAASSFLLGYLSMPREWKIGACVCLLLSPAKLSYVIYKLHNISKMDSSHTALVKSTTACWVGALVVHLIVIITGLIVFRNFGKGLKQTLQGRQDILPRQERDNS